MAVTAPPESIRRYRILSELGHGAMGRVYLAEDPRIGRRIALKVLSPRQLTEPEDEDELRERFLLEARASGRLIHPGIVAVFDADTDPESGDPYLAMEWVDGRNLRDLLKASGRVETARAVDLAAQVAAALDYAHRHHVIHRDVKPANLLVTRDGAVKVTDFGIAKLKSQALTLPGHILGSPYYMAPEQVKGEPVDGRADLFSLGVVLYECLTGVRAFGGETLANVTYKIVWGAPQAPEIRDPSIPPELQAILDRTLRKDPRERFQTGAELEHELRAVAAQLEPPKGTAWSEKASAFSVTRSTSATGGSAGSVELEGPTVYLPSLRAKPADTDASRTSRPASRKLRDGLVPALFVVLLLAVMGWSAGILSIEDRWPFGDPEPPVAPATPTAPTAGESFVPASESSVTERTAVSIPEDFEVPVPPDPEAEQGHKEDDGSPRAPAATVEEVQVEEVQVEEVQVEEVQVEEVQVEEVPAPAPPPPVIPAALLEVVYENRLKAAYISVWVDGTRHLYNRMEARGFFKRMVGQEFRRTVSVDSGQRFIEVHVSGVAKRKIEIRRSLQAELSSRELNRLEVKLKKVADGFDLELALGATARSHRSPAN